MADEKVLSKIKKMLALANNGGATPEEAQSAMLKAQEFMAKYGISVSEVSALEASERIKEVLHGKAFEASSLMWWHKELATIIGLNFRCTPYLSGYKGHHTVMFLGLKEDVEIAAEIYIFAKDAIDYHARKYRKDMKKETLKEQGFKDMSSPELEELAEARGMGYELNELIWKLGRDHYHYRTKLVAMLREAVSGKSAVAIRNDFIKGFLAGLKAQFKEQVERNNWGLILVKDKDVIVAEKAMNLKRGPKQGAVAGQGDAGAYKSGYEKGKSFSKPAGLIN